MKLRQGWTVAALCLLTAMLACTETGQTAARDLDSDISTELLLPGDTADRDRSVDSDGFTEICLPGGVEPGDTADRDRSVDSDGFTEICLPGGVEPGDMADRGRDEAMDGLAEAFLQYGEEAGQESAYAVFGGLHLSGQLPARWYAGDYGRRPAQKYQGNYGTCWALTAVSALEAAVLPERHIAFSADHMANKNAYTVDVDAGGSYQMVMAYLSGWQGPVQESEDPYGDGFSPDGLEAAVHVQELQLLDGSSTDEIKQAVMEYGAVQTSLYMSRGLTRPDSSYYNEDMYAYYYPWEQTQNHDVLILGWDDSFSRFRFRSFPERDGAFICMNWWNGFGDDSIFYVSYCDANIARTGLVCSRAEDVDNYDRLYQADSCGWMGSLGYGSRECWFANVYTASEMKAEAAEYLSAVGFYATAPGGTYEICLAHDFTDLSSFASMKHVGTAETGRCGYYTVDLAGPERLEAGERFAVIVKMSVPEGRAAAAVEFAGSADAADVTLEGCEGYLSRTGRVWENTEEAYRSNVCLKAYTQYKSNP